MNINMQGHNLVNSFTLKSTKERMERQAKRDNQIAFFEQQKEKLKNRKTDSIEDIAWKLELLHGYNDKIAAAKAEYNHSQMFSVLDEARERAERIAEEAEKYAPKTPEERREDLIEEATGVEKDKGLLADTQDELEEIAEEIEETEKDFKQRAGGGQVMRAGNVGNVGNGAGAAPMPRGQGNDPYSRNIQNQIAGAQKQLQELGDNKELSSEEKMKKRQEIQQQINDLQNQLRQHQIEQRKENSQKQDNSSEEMNVGDQQNGIHGRERHGQHGHGLSCVSMQTMISADASLDQVKVQGAVKTQMEGKASVIKAEIQQDSARGGDVKKKQEELAALETKIKETQVYQGRRRTMSTNVGTTYADHVSRYQQNSTKKAENNANEINRKKNADAEKEQAATVKENGVVYEKSDSSINTDHSLYSINKMSQTDREAITRQLQADMEKRQQQFLSVVQKTISGQAGTYGKATGNDLWRTLASGNFTVDAATKEQAQKDIGEDGYWGVKQTSQRLFDFASALVGDDVEKMKKMQAAMEKGFRQAAKAWGRELPGVSKDTLAAANSLFDAYYKSKEMVQSE